MGRFPSDFDRILAAAGLPRGSDVALRAGVRTGPIESTSTAVSALLRWSPRGRLRGTIFVASGSANSRLGRHREATCSALLRSPLLRKSPRFHPPRDVSISQRPPLRRPFGLALVAFRQRRRGRAVAVLHLVATWHHGVSSSTTVVRLAFCDWVADKALALSYISAKGRRYSHLCRFQRPWISRPTRHRRRDCTF